MTSYRSLFELTGRTAMVTGGAGILGSRFCAGIAEMGANVAVVDIAAEAATELAAKLASEHGVKAVGYACDISQPEQVTAAVAAIIAEFGAIDILLNNAASKSSDLDACFAPLETYSLKTWREMMDVNVDGMFLIAQAVGAHMAGRGRGAIVQTGSIYGPMAPDQRIYEGSFYMGRAINCPPAYTASKGAVIAMTKHLATYWADKGVRVNCLCPGGVESGQNDIFKSGYSARIPMGRMAQADEMVGAVLYLVSDAASYVNGHVLMVDGGLSAW
ncbi:MAG: SDR family oxidoreductase [Rhodospirillaceae bacterium]|nr:SDR family oxidoreductase [Rhodospirillales bacterium]